MRKISYLLVICWGIFSFSSGYAMSCKPVHSAKAAHEGPLLNGKQVVETYKIKQSSIHEFLFRFARDVENDYSWAQAGNPRFTPSHDSLIVDMYRFQSFELSDAQKRALIDGRRSIPGQILFKHVLFQNVL